MSDIPPITQGRAVPSSGPHSEQAQPSHQRTVSKSVPVTYKRRWCRSDDLFLLLSKSIQGTPLNPNFTGHPSILESISAVQSIHPSIISTVKHGSSVQDNGHSVCWRTDRMIQEAVGNNNRADEKKLGNYRLLFFLSLSLLSPVWLCHPDTSSTLYSQPPSLVF